MFNRMLATVPTRRVRRWTGCLSLAVALLLITTIALEAASDASRNENELAIPSTATFDAFKLGNSEYCGHCHTDIYQQWKASTHHFSSFNNPIYRKVALTTLQEKGIDTLEFCIGCHDPVLQVSGTLAQEDFDGWAANAGITCLSCHRIVEPGDKNGLHQIAEPTLHPFALTESQALQAAHKFMLEVTPALHRWVLSKPFYKEPEYCASCHTLKVPAALNGSADITLLDEYHQWQNSPFHKNASASGAAQTTCIDCHMPEVASDDPTAKDGFVRSHSFAGSHTALPVFNRDFEHLKKVTDFLSSGIVTMAFSGARVGKSGPFIDIKDLDLATEETLGMVLGITNAGVGHNFPGGVADSNQAWLSIEVRDRSGDLIYSQGNLDKQGELPADAISFGRSYADQHGNHTDRRNTTTDAVSVVSDTLIGPGATRTVYFDFKLPNATSLPITVEAKLNWRKYSPAFMDWVFDGREIPELPITTLASVTTHLPTISQQDQITPSSSE